MTTSARTATLSLVVLAAGLACGDATSPAETSFSLVPYVGSEQRMRNGALTVLDGVRAPCSPSALRGVASRGGATLVLRAVATVPSPCPDGAAGGYTGYQWRLSGYGGAEYRVLRLHEVITGGATRTDTVSDGRWRIP